MKSVAFYRVGLFVDWNSQLRKCPDSLTDAIDKCGFTLRSVGKSATKILCALDSTRVYRVRVRLYHGWTSGVTQTENRRAFLRLSEFGNPDEIFPSQRVLAASDIEFGDRLIDALPIRENKGLRIHLPNTLRRQSGRAQPVEKMVDTALAVDLLSWARAEPDSIALVFSDDDDMVPPVFVAESWMTAGGGRLFLVRSSERPDSKFLALEGLLK